jgi:hypothetical protein
MMELIKNTFVRVATDCPALVGTVPTFRGGEPTIASLQHELLIARPYRLTLEDLMLAVHLKRQGLTKTEGETMAEEICEQLFGKPYPCMRASLLPKKFGWGVHYDAKGRLALFGVDTTEYKRFANGEEPGVEVVPAMRSKRA